MAPCATLAAPPKPTSVSRVRAVRTRDTLARSPAATVGSRRQGSPARVVRPVRAAQHPRGTAEKSLPQKPADSISGEWMNYECPGMTGITWLVLPGSWTLPRATRPNAFPYGFPRRCGGRRPSRSSPQTAGAKARGKDRVSGRRGCAEGRPAAQGGLRPPRSASLARPAAVRTGGAAGRANRVSAHCAGSVSPGERQPRAARTGRRSPGGIAVRATGTRVRAPFLSAGEGSRQPWRRAPNTGDRLPTRVPESQADGENFLEAPTRVPAAARVIPGHPGRLSAAGWGTVNGNRASTGRTTGELF